MIHLQPPQSGKRVNAVRVHRLYVEEPLQTFISRKRGALSWGATESIIVVKRSSTNSIPTFGPHQRKTHGYKSGLSGYAYPSGISR